MKFWVLARGENIEEQLLVSAESTDDLRKCLESLLHVSIRQISVTDFQSQVVDKLQSQHGGNDIITVNLRTQSSSSSTTAASAPNATVGGHTPKGGEASTTAVSEASFSGNSGNPFIFSGCTNDDFQTPAPLSRTNSQSRMSSGPPTNAASDKLSGATGGPPMMVSMNTSRRGSGTAAELFNADLMLPVDRICLTRESITALLSATFRGTFHDVVKGCFVRVRGASSLATSASGYAVVQVVSITSDTQIGLDLVHVVEIRHLDVVSNSPPTADEVRIWAKHMLHAGRSPVTPAFIEVKLSDVNDALRTVAASGANLAASMSFSGSVGSGGPQAPSDRPLAREREATTVGAPWEASLTDDAPPMPFGALDESSPPLTAVSTGSGSKLRRRQTMFLHPQNFLISFTADGGETTTPTKTAGTGTTAPPPASSVAKGNSPSNSALVAGTSPSHSSSSLLLRAHMAINQAHEVVVSDDDDDFNNSTTSTALSTTGALPPPPPLQASTSAKSLIKQRLDSISQAMSQHQQRLNNAGHVSGGDPGPLRRASSGGRVVDPSQGPVTPQSGRNSSNEPSPQGSTGTQHPSPVMPAFAPPPPPPPATLPSAPFQPPQPLLVVQPAIPPLAPSSAAQPSITHRSVVSLNDSLLNGWLLQHQIEDGSFEYMLFGTRHSNPKARRLRTSDFAGCCMTLVDHDEERSDGTHDGVDEGDVAESRSGRRQLFHSVLQLKSDVDRDVTVKGFVVHCAPQLFRGVFVAFASHAADFIDPKHGASAHGGSEGESPATSPHRAEEHGSATSTIQTSDAPPASTPSLQTVSDASRSNAYEFIVLSGRDVTSLYNPPFKTHLPIPAWGAPMSQPHAVLRPQLVFASGVLHVFYLVGLLGGNSSATTTNVPSSGPVSSDGGSRRSSSGKTNPLVAVPLDAPRSPYGLAHAVCSDARLSHWTLLNPTDPIVQQQADQHSGLLPHFSVYAGCIPSSETCGSDTNRDDGLTLMWCEPTASDAAYPPPRSGGRFRSPSAPRSHEDSTSHNTVPTPPQRSQSPPPRDDVNGPAQLHLHVTPPRRSSQSVATVSERSVFPFRVLVNVDDNFRSGAWTPHECSVPDLAAVLAQPVGDRCAGVLDDITRHPQGLKCMSLVRRQHRHQVTPALASGSGPKPPAIDNALLVVVGEDRHHRATILLLPANVH
jgi:hypothetical protein